MTPPKRLLRDGFYSKGKYDGIDAYTEAGQAGKDHFLRDARALLKAAGKPLAAAGYTLQHVTVNPSGVAGSGDAYAYYYRPENLAGVYCTIGASCVGLGGRQDGITFMARRIQGDLQPAQSYRHTKPLKFPRDKQ